ncbi:MAG: LacI family DNA-binding transcriptional regulator [Sedimentisphaeraceae bacterium JB056]
MTKKVTMKDIAKKVGVSHPVVSAVINDNYKSVKVSEKTRKRVLEVVKEMSYFPNAAGRSLSNRRTSTIGFLLSDNAADGLSNAFYSRFLAAIEDACRRKKYGLNVSLYNLSNVDTFVFPQKVGQRSVDGLILAGYLEKTVVNHFREFGIPCICLGEDMEFENMIANVCTEIVPKLFEIFDYLVGLGHKKIGICDESHRHENCFSNRLRRQSSEAGRELPADIVEFTASTGFCDYQSGQDLYKEWVGLDINQRPTAMISSDQTVISFMQQLRSNGFRCPEDVSVVSTCDSRLCEYASPAVTAIRHPAVEMGEAAVNILVKAIEEDVDLTAADSVHHIPCKIIYRESCREI